MIPTKRINLFLLELETHRFSRNQIIQPDFSSWDTITTFESPEKI